MVAVTAMRMSIKPEWMSTMSKALFMLGLVLLLPCSGNDDKRSIAIVGKVVDASGGPVEGACASIEVRTPFGPKLLQTWTNASGVYSLDLPLQDYHDLILIVAADGRSQGFANFDMFEEENKYADKKRYVLETTITPARETVVKVTDSHGMPVPDADVTVQGQYRRLAFGKSNAQGEVKLSYPVGVPLQTIGAVKAGHGLDYRAFEAPSDSANKSHPNKLSQDFTGPVELSLNGIREVSIKVLAPDGSPLSGVVLRPWLMEKPDRGGAWNLPALAEFQRTTDQTGVATFDMLAIDQVRGVDFWPILRNERWFTMGSDPNHLDGRATIRWDGPPTATLNTRSKIKIGGSVKLSDGTPAIGIKVEARGGFHYSDWYSQTAETDRNGQWEMWVKPDGYYLLVARDAKLGSKPYCTIIREENESPTFDFVLQPGKRIYGKVEGTIDRSTIVMLQQRAADYYRIPEDQRLPNPSKSGRVVSAFTQDSKPVDSEGNFEFVVGPGEFTIWSPDRKTTKFSLDDEDVGRTFTFETVGPSRGDIKIVVLEAETDKPTPNCNVDFHPSDFLKRGFEAVTGSDGVIKITRNFGNGLLVATTKDHKFGGTAKIMFDDKESEIYVYPTWTLKGYLKDEEGKPLEGQTVECSIKIQVQNLSRSVATRTCKTGADGSFVLDGLIQGIPYDLDAVLVDKDNQTTLRRIKNVISVEDLEIGDVLLKPET